MLDSATQPIVSRSTRLASKIAMLEVARGLWYDFMARFVPHSEPWEEKWQESSTFEELFHAISFVGAEVGNVHSGKTFTCDINVTCTEADVKRIIQHNLAERGQDVHRFVTPDVFSTLFYSDGELGALTETQLRGARDPARGQGCVPAAAESANHHANHAPGLQRDTCSPDAAAAYDAVSYVPQTRG